MQLNLIFDIHERHGCIVESLKLLALLEVGNTVTECWLERPAPTNRAAATTGHMAAACATQKAIRQIPRKRCWWLAGLKLRKIPGLASLSDTPRMRRRRLSALTDDLGRCRLLYRRTPINQSANGVQLLLWGLQRLTGVDPGWLKGGPKIVLLVGRTRTRSRISQFSILYIFF